jgi:hypothetical protein
MPANRQQVHPPRGAHGQYPPPDLSESFCFDLKGKFPRFEIYPHSVTIGINWSINGISSDDIVTDLVAEKYRRTRRQPAPIP